MTLHCVGVNEVHLRRLTNSRGIIIIIIKSGRRSTKQFPANCPYIAKQTVVSDYTCPLTYASSPTARAEELLLHLEYVRDM